MTPPRPWGFAPSCLGVLAGGLYCVSPDCGAVILPDGTRLYDHTEECETRIYEHALEALLRVTS